MTEIEKQIKTLEDFIPVWSCRFHPINWWHEFGCPHQEWTKNQIEKALYQSKQSNAYLVYLFGKLPTPKQKEAGV